MTAKRNSIPTPTYVDGWSWRGNENGWVSVDCATSDGRAIYAWKNFGKEHNQMTDGYMDGYDKAAQDIVAYWKSLQPNNVWRLDAGDIHNLMDIACDELETTRSRLAAAEAIVRAVAAMTEPEDPVSGMCVLCSRMWIRGRGITHDTNCLWLRARAAVAEWDSQETEEA